MYHTLMYSGMLLGVCDKRSHCGPLLSRYCIMPSHMSSNQASRGCPRVTIQQTVHETKTVLQEASWRKYSASVFTARSNWEKWLWLCKDAGCI